MYDPDIICINLILIHTISCATEVQLRKYVGGLEPHEEISRQRAHLAEDFALPDAALSAKRRYHVDQRELRS